MLHWLLPLLACVSADVLMYSTITHEIEAEFSSLTSRFGEAIPFEGIRGMVVPAEPEDACTSIQPPPSFQENFTKHWIALIKRYNCNFDVKVRNAQIAGFSVAIVHNVNSSMIEPMGPEYPFNIHIPSVFVGSDSAELMKEHYLYPEPYYALIKGDATFTPNLLLAFAILVGLCFLIMVIFIIVKYLKERRRQRRHRLPRSCLKEMPIHKFKKNDPYDICAICLEEYIDGDKLRVLPCSHAYHSKCIDPWLTKSRRFCPVCKRKVFASCETISDSETETEDERAPLVRAGGHTTQGGTFDQRVRNALHGGTVAPQRARQVTTSSSSASSSAGSTPSPPQTLRSHPSINSTGTGPINVTIQPSHSIEIARTSSSWHC